MAIFAIIAKMISVNPMFAARLKDAGFSLTGPRQVVFSVLQDSGPLTIKQLYEKLHGKVDRTTVYRVVSLLENLNIVQKVSHGWKYTLELTDQFVPHHHHFTCSGCERIISFDEPSGLDELLNKTGELGGFSISSHTLEIVGLCATCRRES